MALMPRIFASPTITAEEAMITSPADLKARQASSELVGWLYITASSTCT